MTGRANIRFFYGAWVLCVEVTG